MKSRRIAIIDYGMGNSVSIGNMLKAIGAECCITSDTRQIEEADMLILPGVGSFDAGMSRLHQTGILTLLKRKVIEERTPILGICLGMQVFTERSEEGQLPGLGWLSGETIRFRFDKGGPRLHIPHMGWNEIHPVQQHPLLSGLESESRFYFVHSYHVLCDDPADVLAFTDYGHPFASIIRRDNIIGTQFHPEKSHRYGMRLLANFMGVQT
ncbi:MAG: imidazole glycerol phosphate synthase subunit HisH [Desulfobacteraceae bacterium]|nr:MAG: imidazole glycerol phosphate synthase subunit HisH [Desulfobacteraceae bacterium]